MEEEQENKNKKKRRRRRRRTTRRRTKVVTAKLKSQDGVFILEFLLLYIIVNFYRSESCLRFQLKLKYGLLFAKGEAQIQQERRAV
jgi:hypothetical protein